MIRDIIPRFFQRLSEVVFAGRNRSRIVLGTDRKNTIDSGYGDGGKNDPQSSMVDIVAGFVEQNPSYTQDASRVYLSEKSDPDDYFAIDAGPKAVGEASAVVKSDNAYIVASGMIKIVHPNCKIIITPEGIQIESTSTKIKSGGSVIEISQTGDIILGNETGISARIITENDIGKFDPSTGNVSFQPALGAILTNNKVKIK